MCMVVEGSRPKGRPRETWMEGVRNDMKELGLASSDALNLRTWMRKCADPGLRGARLGLLPG